MSDMIVAVETTFIYVLKEPDTGEIRYVGKADDPEQRLFQHLKDPKRNHRTNWIKSLKDSGKIPVLEIVDEVPTSEWSFWEAAYIQFYLENGAELTNGTLGGEGGSPTRDVREKIGLANRGKRRSVEHCQKMSKLLTGKKYPPKSGETCEKLSQALMGHEVSEETRAKIGAANTGKVRSPEVCQKLSKIRKGKPKSLPHCAAISRGLLGKKKSPEHIAKIWESRRRNNVLKELDFSIQNCMVSV